MSKFDTSWKAGTSWIEKLGSWDTEALGALHPGPHTLQQAGGMKRAGPPHNYYGIIFIF
jgi:hypothetical protein